jgi:hypothetical protein
MATSGSTSRLLAGAWTGIALQAAGQVVDLRWHATHPGFERAADQLRAHWLIWLGVLVAIGKAAILAGAISATVVTRRRRVRSTR